MEIVIQLLLVLALLSALFQMSHWQLPARLIAACALAVFAYFLYPWVIEQSRDQLAVWMSNSQLMQNLAVVQVIEAILFIVLDLELIRQYFGQTAKKYYRWLRFFPGIIVLAAVLHLQMNCFYTFSSLEFETLGILSSVGLGITFFLLPAVILWLIPEGHLRMELRYILGFGQVLGGVVITVFCQGLPYAQQNVQFESGPLLTVSGLFLVSALIGWLWYKRPTKIS